MCKLHMFYTCSQVRNPANVAQSKEQEDLGFIFE